MFGTRERSDHGDRKAYPPAPRLGSDSNDARRVIVVANRAPFRHEHAPDGAVLVSRSASGVVTALEPVVRAYSGIWVAHASGNADAAVAADRGGLNVPSASPEYRLRYVRLSKEVHRGYYYGFANEGLWPLCHAVHVRPAFRPRDFQMYLTANQRFADAVLEEADGGAPLVFVQDYHFALTPRLLRERLPSSVVVAFWHVPWPNPRVFRTCPWARELLHGLLGSDVIGFQTAEDCINFFGSVESVLDAVVDQPHNSITYKDRATSVRDYPVGIDCANEAVRTIPGRGVCRESVCRDLHLPADVRLAIGVDRLDYTKGINEKVLAIERLLDVRPDLRDHFVLVQVAEPSRGCLPAYQAARAQLLETSERVNSRFGTSSYRPIRLLEAHHEPAELYRLYRAADLCYVGSLHDGMNLVAKEFVAAREDERGVLILSQFAGAAQQLDGALLINPYDIRESADVLARALAMSIVEQTERMRGLRANVACFDASWWAQELVLDADTREPSGLSMRTIDNSVVRAVPA